MKSRIAMTLIILEIALAMWIGLALANNEIELYVYTNKASYGYGDEGMLYVTVWNKGGAVTVKNIEVRFPWERPHLWNYTISEIEEAIGKEKKDYEITFNVPSESRNAWNSNIAQVTLNYEDTDEISKTKETTIPINIEIPVYEENIMPIYYLTAVLISAVIVVIFELYFVWRRLGKQTPTTTIT